MKRSGWIFPAIVVALAVLLLGSFASRARSAGEEGKMAIHEFAQLPVVDRGRMKPLDTLARTSLMIISDRQTFRDADGNKQPAIRWLLDVMSGLGTGDTKANDYRIFRIENDQVLDMLGLEARMAGTVEHSDQRFRYAINEFRDKMDEFAEQAERAKKVRESDPESLTLFQRKVLELADQVTIYVTLARLEKPHLIPPESNDGEWKTYAEINAQAQRAAFDRVRADVPAGVDPRSLSNEQLEDLQNKLDDAIREARAKANPAFALVSTMLLAYEAGEVDLFNESLEDYKAYLAGIGAVTDDEFDKSRFEVFFNRFAPFTACIPLYLLAGLLGCFSWLVFEKPLNRAAFSLLLLTLVVHTFAIGTRMYLQGRPPITNLYSTAIFIGLACLVLSLILEGIYRNGIGNVVAGATGFLSLLVANGLSSDGDTLEMMQAVLDTNFWLATHVTIINLGYAATFLAGFLAILFVLRGVFTTSLDKENVKALGRMVYGTICFATLLSFVGTVLGGIWADYSWGRFWGWDPKENGALMIVLWNALILHARWGGIVRQRGMAVLAIFGNIITAWSWFGVNMLGVGLHSYGFMDGALFWTTTFVASQLLLMAVGMLPTHAWRSWRSFAAPVRAAVPRVAPQMDRERDG